MKIIAAVLGCPLDVPRDGDFGASFGAARLAICAAEGAAPADVLAPQAVEDTITPDPALRDRYLARLAEFRALYPAISGVQTQ